MRQEFHGNGVNIVIGTLLPGTIINGANAVNQNTQSFSTISVPLGLDLGVILKSDGTQFLEFINSDNTPRTIISSTANPTPVTIKLGLAKSLVGLLDNIHLQPFTNLSKSGSKWQATPAGTGFQLNNLLNLANGSGEIEVTISPTANYQGVWIKLGSALSLGLSANIYHAFIEETETTAVNCNEIIDVLAGVRPGALGGIANATGSVSNQWNVADNNDNTAATLNVGLQVLSEVYLTSIFKTPSVPKDSIEIILQKDGGGILDLDLINGFSIMLYNGKNLVRTLNSSSSFLNLSLLSGSSGNEKYKLSAEITEVFDRIEIKMGGVATLGLLSKLKIYTIKRKMPDPALFINNESIITPPVICAGNSTILSISNPQTCTEYKWFYDAAGTLPVSGISGSGTNFTTNALNNTITYYVKAQRSNNCNNSSDIIPVTVPVTPLPDITLSAIPEICETTSATSMNITSLTESPGTYSINWNNAALAAGLSNVTEQAIPVNNIISINTVGIPAGTYNGSLKVKNNYCESTTKNIQVKINEKPSIPNVYPQNSQLTTF